MRKLFAAVGLFAVVGSTQAQFCPGVSPWVFDDVLASDSLCPDITWMSPHNVPWARRTQPFSGRVFSLWRRPLG